MAFAVGEADDLVLDGGAIARPGAGDLAGIHRRAVQIGADDAWVARVVRVMRQAIWGVVIALVRNEKGAGGSSPACISRAAQSMVRPSRRGGVPVFSRPMAGRSHKASWTGRWRRRLSIAVSTFMRPAGICALADMDQAVAGRCRWSAPPRRRRFPRRRRDTPAIVLTFKIRSSALPREWSRLAISRSSACIAAR